MQGNLGEQGSLLEHLLICTRQISHSLGVSLSPPSSFIGTLLCSRRVGVGAFFDTTVPPPPTPSHRPLHQDFFA